MTPARRKLLGVLLAVAVLVGTFTVTTIAAETTFSPEGDPLTYTVLSESEKTVAVSGGESGLTSITIPSTVTYEGETYKVTEIARKAFANYTTITELKFAPDSNLIKIREDAFAYTGQDSTTVPATISKLTLPASLETVEDGAFHCIPVEEFALEANSKLTAIPNGFLAADGHDGQPGVGTECTGVFDYINKVWIHFEEPYPFTPKQVAEACNCLESIDLGEGNSLTRIGDGAFKNQGYLTEIDFGTGDNELTIGHGAFVAAGNNAFSGGTLNDGIETLTFPANLAEMGSGSFRLARVKNVVFSDNCKVEAVGYSFLGVDGSDGQPGASSTVPQDVLNAANCLESVSFGANNSLKCINSAAFKNQSHLTEIDFGTPVNDLTIEYGAFIGVGNNAYLVEQGIDDSLCDGIETLTFPANLKSIGGGSFRLARVKNLVFSDNCKLESVGYSLLVIDGSDGQPGASSTVPQAVINAANCLESVKFGANNSLKTINSAAFKNQSHLTEIDFGTPVNDLTIEPGAFIGAGNNAFLVEQGIDDSQNAGLDTLVLPANLKSIGSGSLRYVRAKQLVCEEGCKLTKLDGGVLSDNDELTTVDLRGSNIATIGDALERNPKLTCVYFPETLESVTWANSNETLCPFYGCGEVNELHFAATDPSGYTFTDDVFQFLNEAGIVYVPADTTDEAIDDYVTKLTAAGLTFGPKNWKIEREHVHDLTKTEATEPTCTEAGNSEYWTCSVCGKYFSDEAGKVEIKKNSWVIPATGHDWGEWTVTKEPTATQTGERTRTCKNDASHVETETIPATGGGSVTPPAPLPPTGDEPGSKTPFVDVDDTAPYVDAVVWAVENGITTGTTPTTFSPDLTVTRGMAVTFLWRAMGEPKAKTAVNPFTDVKESDYFYDAVLWAVENGITKGTSATTFSPALTNTNAHMLTFLYRTLGSPDATGAEPWYADAMNWAVAKKIAPATTDPNANCPRSSVVQFLYLALGK